MLPHDGEFVSTRGMSFQLKVVREWTVQIDARNIFSFLCSHMTVRYCRVVQRAKGHLHVARLGGTLSA